MGARVVQELSDGGIVILGQDPYQTRGLADGLAFSVPTECLIVPPSLRRILGEAARVATIAPGRTSLVPWAKQGVLLLNTALTVPKGKPGGHAKEWRPVTGAILRAVGGQAGPVAFMAWGTHGPGRPRSRRDRGWRTAHRQRIRAPDGTSRVIHRVESVWVREREAERRRGA